jgi:hypothetical protein
MIATSNSPGSTKPTNTCSNTNINNDNNNSNNNNNKSPAKLINDQILINGRKSPNKSPKSSKLPNNSNENEANFNKNESNLIKNELFNVHRVNLQMGIDRSMGLISSDVVYSSLWLVLNPSLAVAFDNDNNKKKTNNNNNNNNDNNNNNNDNNYNNNNNNNNIILSSTLTDVGLSLTSNFISRVLNKELRRVYSTGSFITANEANIINTNGNTNDNNNNNNNNNTNNDPLFDVSIQITSTLIALSYNIVTEIDLLRKESTNRDRSIDRDRRRQLDASESPIYKHLLGIYLSI